MDKKTKINFSGWLVTVALFFGVFPIMAQDVSKVQFCDRNYTYKAGSDSITVFFNLLDAAGKRVKDVPEASLRNYLVIKEDGKYIPAGRTLVSTVNAGQRSRFIRPSGNWSNARPTVLCIFRSLAVMSRRAECLRVRTMLISKQPLLPRLTVKCFTVPFMPNLWSSMLGRVHLREWHGFVRGIIGSGK